MEYNIGESMYKNLTQFKNAVIQDLQSLGKLGVVNYDELKKVQDGSEMSIIEEFYEGGASVSETTDTVLKILKL